MKLSVATLPALLALGLLTGCARGLEARVAKLESDNAELKQKVASLSAGGQLLERRVRGHEFPPGFGDGPRADHWGGPPPARRPGPPGGPPNPPGRRDRGGPPPGRRF